MKTRTVPRPTGPSGRFLMALLLTTFLVPLPGTHADPGTFYSGAKIIANTYTGLIGKTTVTPAHAINQWTRSHYGYYRNLPVGTRLRVQRDLLGVYRYATDYMNLEGRWILAHRDPFPVDTLRIWNHSCDRSITNPDGTVVRFVTRIVENFEIAVWAANVVRTGHFSPSGPFEAHLKSTTTALNPSCDPVPPTTSDVRSRAFDLPLSGTVRVQMPIVNRSYAWPMYCWIGKFYHGL